MNIDSIDGSLDMLFLNPSHYYPISYYNFSPLRKLYLLTEMYHINTNRIYLNRNRVLNSNVP